MEVVWLPKQSVKASARWDFLQCRCPLSPTICYCSLLFHSSPFLFILIHLPNSPLKPISFPFNQLTQAQPKFKINPITNSHFYFKTLFHPSPNYSLFIFFSLYFYKTHNLIFFSIFINKEFNLINYYYFYKILINFN